VTLKKNRRLVIIGCGTAALTALKQIRKTGRNDEVLLLSMEAYSPYSPMSLPYLVSERVKGPDIHIVNEEFFRQMDATLMKETRVVGLLPSERKILFESGESIQYDRLLIATGSDPIVPQILKEAGCAGFHTMDDCLALIRRLQNRRRIGIIGAGLVGMELAAALREKGHEVSVVAPREKILRNYFDAEAGRIIRDLFTDAGVAVHLNWGEAVSARQSGGETHVLFGREKTLDAEIVLSCMGVSPRISFLAGTGVSIDRGVVVDRHMSTNIPDVFAAGDVAEAADFFTGETGFNPILPNAVSQGKVAGSNMAGETSEYGGWVSMNTFNFFGHLATSIGRTMAGPGDEELVRKEESGYKKMVLTGSTLVGATFIDTRIDAGVIQYLIRMKAQVGSHKGALLNSPRETAFWLMNDMEKQQTLAKEE
jgi:phenylglyoxylate dehydrogenase epsilon subunit